MVLDWQENLPSNEMPPEWMWPFAERLTDWFKEVKRKRDEKYGNDSVDDDSDMGASWTMAHNEMADEMKAIRFAR